MNVCALVSSAKSEVIIRGHKSSDCFEYQKNPYLNQATQIFLQKKNRNRKFQTQKSFYHSRHLKSGVQPSPPGLFSCQKNLHNHCLLFLVGESGNNGQAKF